MDEPDNSKEGPPSLDYEPKGAKPAPVHPYTFKEIGLYVAVGMIVAWLITRHLRG
jgi:hypothetical protein